MIETPEGFQSMFKLPELAFLADVRRFLDDDGGATAIEYAVLASGVAVVIAATIVSLGTSVNGLYASVLTAMK
jgi:pilus assembly protein Flp/PilA